MELPTLMKSTWIMNKASNIKERGIFSALLYFKSFFILLLFFSVSQKLNGQWHLDRWLISNLKFTDITDPAFDVENNRAYFFDFSNEHYSYQNDTVRIFSYSLNEENDTALIKIGINNFPVLIPQTDATNLCVSGENLILLYPNALLVFDISKRLLRNLLPLGPNFQYFVETADNELIYLVKNYNSFRARFPKVMASAYNLRKGRFVKDGNIVPPIDGIGFTHLGYNQWFTSIGNDLVYINPLNGQLDIYDSLGTRLNHYQAFINPDSSLLIKLHDSLLNLYDRDPKNLISKLLELDKRFMRAEKILSLNDSSLALFLVPQNNNGKKEREIRILAITKNGLRVKQIFTDKEPGALSKIDRESFPMFSFFSGQIKSEEGHLYRILPDIPMKYEGMNYGKVKLKRQSYSLRHLPVYHLWEFSLNP